VCVCACRIWLGCALKPLVLLSSSEARSRAGIGSKIGIAGVCVCTYVCVCGVVLEVMVCGGGLLLLVAFSLKQRTQFYNFIFETMAADFSRVYLGRNNYF